MRQILGRPGEVWGAESAADQLVVIRLVPDDMPGDYNQDGIVDAADYVVWRDNEGTTNSLPNDLIGGTIGTAHYNQWRPLRPEPPVANIFTTDLRRTAVGRRSRAGKLIAAVFMGNCGILETATSIASVITR